MGLCVVASDTAAMVVDAWAWEVVEVVAPFVTGASVVDVVAVVAAVVVLVVAAGRTPGVSRG